MAGGSKIPAIPAVLAVIVLIAVVWMGGGGIYPTSPDPDKGARADSGPLLTGIDNFYAYTNGSEIIMKRMQRKGRIRIREACKGPVSAVAASPEAGLMAAAGAGAEIRLWDILPLKRGKRPRPAGSLPSSVFNVRALAFSADGSRLLVVGESAAELWNTLSKSSVARQDGPWPDSGSLLFYARVSAIRAGGARLEYVENENAVERGGTGNPPVLMDAVSELAVNTFGKAWAESWGPEGRYRGYGDGGNVIIWRLCRSAACRPVTENGKVVMR